MDAVDPGGLGGTFGGNPVSCAAANVVLDQVAGACARRSEALGVRLRAALEDMATRVDAIGEVRGLGPMLALEIVRDRETKTPGARARRRRDRRRPRAGPAAARLRPARQRHPPAAAADDHRRGADARAGDPRGGAGVNRHAPLDPLSADEFRQAAAILRRDHGVGERWRFASIELQGAGEGRPTRSAREAIVVCWNRDGGAAYRAVVSLDRRRASSAGRTCRASSPTSRPTSGTSATRRCAPSRA